MRWFNDNTVAKSENLLVGLLPEAARTATSPFYGLCALGGVDGFYQDKACGEGDK
jgi:hypothetical protein